MKETKDTRGINNFNCVFEFFRKNDSQIEYFGQTLGKNSYWEIREVKLKKNIKMMAAKLVKKDDDNDNNLNEIQLVEDLRGNNIIKINKIISKEYNREVYDLIIMENSILRDLGKMTKFCYRPNLLKLIIHDQQIEDNFLRFYAKQIIDGIETFDRNDYVLFDIKPENLLTTIYLNIKLSDSCLITNVKNGDKIKIKGGTQGYLTEEYYNKKIDLYNSARKHNYFALGSTIFYQKTRTNLLKDQRFEDFMSNIGRNIDLINNTVKRRKDFEQELIEFLISLIYYTINESHSSFEAIYRNKWLHKNRDELELIIVSNENDEGKTIMELQKSDYLINKKKEMKPKQNFRFKKKNYNDIL